MYDDAKVKQGGHCHVQASAFQLRLQREAEAKEREKAAAEKAAAAKRVVSEEDYSQLVDVRDFMRLLCNRNEA